MESTGLWCPRFKHREAWGSQRRDGSNVGQPPKETLALWAESDEGCSGNSLEVTTCLQPACDSAKYHRHDAPTIWSERAQARDRIRHRSRDGRLLSVRL